MADSSTQQTQDTNPPSQDTDTPGSDAATTAASAPANVSGSKRKPPVPKSSVWDHFVKLPLEETNGEPRAKCKYCKDHTYACDTSKHGTTSLKKHLLKCKGYPYRAQEKKQNMLAFLQPSGSGGLGPNLVPYTYNQEECCKALAEFVICDEQPFRVVEGHGFRKYSNRLEPRFPVPSRVTVARDCYKLFIEESKKLKAFLKKSCMRVCLTTDTWTSVQNFNYMCLTAHFIDENWRLQKRILNFCIIENHRGDTIGKAIEKCLLGWGIEKVFSITVDNASSNDTAVAYLKKRLKNWNGLVCDGDYLHVRCCAHILNLVVNDGLKDLHNFISAIRNAVRCVRSSPARLQRFKDLVQKEKIDCKALVCLDIMTRWNSTYLMLEHALKFQKVFDRMEDEDDGYNAYFRDDTHRLGPPMTFDWSNAYVFVQFLKVFYTITLRFSGSLYVTSNSCFHDIAHVHTMLQASAVHQDPLIGEMAKKMKLKYDKYWGKPENMNPLLVIGVVLDPRYKFGYVNNTFNDIYDNDPILCESMKKKVKDTLYLLYDKYSVGVVGEQSEHEEESGDSGAINHPGDLPMPDFVTANPNPKGKWWSGRTKHPSDQKTDLDKYLETDAIDDAPSFDVLTWWRENATKYKVVSLIARDVLVMLVSTVASESAFSTGGRVLDVFRSSLSPKMTKALICTQNWLSPTEFNFNDRDFDQYEETDSIASDVSRESTV
ncbi:zinc finger BED domain-containing protein RICESLEEPER 2-like [Senna tora]|uniref:Zinc finger BED domain-containing protein RICESLEEPER 2-like n=1 Tax=Senna tora TaxID=362788 RepID=A0A834XAB5_9FABA|nr:zinc finger BED domain-containing protein RICESLEEPER 2-like [Senna tora]